MFFEKKTFFNGYKDIIDNGFHLRVFKTQNLNTKYFDF